MPLIQRWGLMHCFKSENVSEHCHQVAVVAHLLVIIKNRVFNGNLNPEKAATLALYHEISETKLQDVNTNTKYHNPEFTQAFKSLENLAEEECLATLPAELRGDMEALIVQAKVDPLYKDIVKAADIIQAYIKTKNELRFSNDEFVHVEQHLAAKLSQFAQRLPEVQYFLDVFLNSCTTTVDKLSESN